MEKQEKLDFNMLSRLWELSRMEQVPTAAQEKEFSELSNKLERKLQQSLVLEDKTLKLVKYLKAA